MDRARECAQGQRPSKERREGAEGQQKGEEMPPIAATPAQNWTPFSPDTARAEEEVWPCLQAIPHPPATWGAGYRHLSSSSPSLLTSYVASWLSSGGCCGPRAVLSSSVRVSSFPASASIRFSKAWCELFKPSCKSQRIMCIWAERGQQYQGAGVHLPWNKAMEPMY